MNIKKFILLIISNLLAFSLSSQAVERDKKGYNFGINMAPLTSNSIEVLNDFFISKSLVLGVNFGGNYAPGTSFYTLHDGVDRLTNKALFLKIIPSWYINTEKRFMKPINFRFGLGYALSSYDETGYNQFTDEFVEAKGITSAILATFGMEFKIISQLCMRIGFHRAYSFRKNDHLGSYVKTNQSGLGAMAFGRLHFQTMFGLYWSF
jgi:hypothetical protein